MQRRIGPRNQIAPRQSIGPDIAEFVEVIESATGDEVQTRGGRDARLDKTGRLLRLVTDERRLRTEILRDERPLLPGIDVTVKSASCNGEPSRWFEIVLVIEGETLEER